jgi:EF hand
MKSLFSQSGQWVLLAVALTAFWGLDRINARGPGGPRESGEHRGHDCPECRAAREGHASHGEHAEHYGPPPHDDYWGSEQHGPEHFAAHYGPRPHDSLPPHGPPPHANAHEGHRPPHGPPGPPPHVRHDQGHRPPHAAAHTKSGGCPFCNRAGGRVGHHAAGHRPPHGPPHIAGRSGRPPQHGRDGNDRGSGRNYGRDSAHRPPHGPPPFSHMGHPMGRGGMPGHAGMTSGPAAHFRLMDADHNGKISKEEVLKFHAKLDANHDGEVETSEIIKHHMQAAGERGEHRPAPPKMEGRGHGDHEKEGHGKPEHHGKPEGKEGAGPRTPLGPPPGMPPHGPPHGRPMGPPHGMERGPMGSGPMGPPSPEKLFEHFDKNNDKKLTKDEIPFWERLSQADSNKDNAVTADEMASHMKKRMSEGDFRKPDADRKDKSAEGDKKDKPKPEVKDKKSESSEKKKVNFSENDASAPQTEIVVVENIEVVVEGSEKTTLGDEIFFITE